MDDRQGAKAIRKEKVIKALENQYGFTIQKAELLEGGCTNAGWKLATNIGNWIAKIFGPEEGPKEWIQNEAEMYGYLFDQGIGVPEVLNTAEGTAVGEIRSQDYPYPITVMKLNQLRRAWASEIDQKEIEAIGRELAKIHKALTKFPGRKKIENRFYPPQKEDEAKRPFEIFCQWTVWTKPELAKLAEEEMKMYRYLADKPLPQNLPQTIIHADLGLEHAQFLENGQVYFFDFSDRKVGARVEDMGTFLAMLYSAEDIDLPG
jgi:Ser/Thr protein kinase RdoA (MazF antagonist)